MKAEYINAFLDPTINVVEKSLKVKSTIGQIKKGSSVDLGYPVSVVIGVKGDLSGMIIFGFSIKNANNIIARMQEKKKVSKIKKEEQEALCEFANMIIGNVCGKLYELGLKETLTPPAMVIGASTSFSIPDISNSIIIPVKNKLGEFEINIFLKDERAS